MARHGAIIGFRRALPDHRGADGRVGCEHRRAPASEEGDLRAAGAGRYWGGQSRARSRSTVLRLIPSARAIAALDSPAVQEPMDLGTVLRLEHSFLSRGELLRARACQSAWSRVSRFSSGREVLSIRAASSRKRGYPALLIILGPA